MVLQHSTTANIWGHTRPNAKVKIYPSWITSKKGITVKADADGLWVAPIQTLNAGFTKYSITIKSCGEIKEIKDILFGEVWLCAGQSNMEWPVRKTLDMQDELENADCSHIRLYRTGHITANTPQNDIPKQRHVNVKWRSCEPSAIKDFSAVAYGFGKDLYEALNVPIGLIDASYGGTPIEAWLSVEALKNDLDLAEQSKKIPNAKWKKKISHLHNANIYPLRHATIAGVVWYQGCENISNYATYYRLLSGLVKSWREEFRNPELPFYIVEIAPHVYANIRGARIREAQARVAANNKNCELIVTNDQNFIPGDIHPPKKWDVAHRLAQCALGAHYKKTDKEFRSPAYKSMTVEGNTIRVEFNNVPTTLVQKGEGRINGFQIGVKNPQNEHILIFSLAEAKIEGKTVVVSAEGVENPVAVRYCFNEDVGNVFSAEGLPLRAFRSDKNAARSARPYVEKPSEIAVKVEGEGYTRSVFQLNSKIWSNADFVLTGSHPSEFAGFEVMAPAYGQKNGVIPKGKIIAKGDGKIYLLCYNTVALRNKEGWKAMPECYTYVSVNKMVYPLLIFERNVKAGEVVNIPEFKTRWGGPVVLAKTIE